MTTYNAINNASGRGTENTILGLNAGNSTYDPILCIRNTLCGNLTGSQLTVGPDNSAFGDRAGINLTSGFQQCLFGSGAGANITTGIANIAMGYSALPNLVTGNVNIGIGAATLLYLADGNWNVSLGTLSGQNYTSNESSNILIMNFGVVGESNIMRLGTSGNADGQVNTCYISGITTQVVTDASLYNYVMIDAATEKLVTITSSNSGSKVTDYSTPGSFTWTKDARTKTIQVYGWTGGAGGGSGSKGLAGTALGGDGGSAGSVFYMEAAAMFFGATEAVIVGSGGVGGASQGVDGSNGNNGSTTGTVSSFGNLSPLVNATGGGGGGNVLSIQGPWIYINQQLWSTGGDAAADAGHPASGYGNHDAGSDAEDSGIGLAFGMCPTGGGGGAGRDTISPVLGGRGGKILTMNGLGTLVVGGAKGNRSAGGNGVNGLTSTAGGVVTGGTGGGGGSPNNAGTAGGAGGVGGFPGGGGGGGSGGINGLFGSGPGGQGGGGRIIVVEIF